MKLVMIFFLLLAAGGLMAVASWLAVITDWSPRPAAERGYTMQTLIVTAVLVLVAVAAGVVILAVATSGTDDIDPGDSTDGPCNRVEVFDSVKRDAGDASNAGGKVVGTGLGCIPVCFWLDKGVLGTVEAGELLFIREFPSSGTITVKENAVGSNSVVGGVPGDGQIAAFATGRAIFTAQALIDQAQNSVRAEDDGSTMAAPFASGISQVVVNVQQTGCETRP